MAGLVGEENRILKNDVCACVHVCMSVHTHENAQVWVCVWKPETTLDIILSITHHCLPPWDRVSGSWSLSIDSGPGGGSSYLHLPSSGIKCSHNTSWICGFWGEIRFLTLVRLRQALYLASTISPVQENELMTWLGPSVGMCIDNLVSFRAPSIIKIKYNIDHEKKNKASILFRTFSVQLNSPPSITYSY